jgi:SpoVK/Ycf46/Vps4 family AAA+-type ATPase
VSASDIGTGSHGLETQLSAIFDLANHWNAILLIDEADVFLKKRSSRSLDRNGLVSVFLRNLEYFQGILILTTNRVETFDDAVQSRINLPLKFNGLDEPARKAIWMTFLERSCKTRGETGVMNVVNLDQLERLARKQLNGREVRCLDKPVAIHLCADCSRDSDQKYGPHSTLFGCEQESSPFLCALGGCSLRNRRIQA